jgi:hypothetical protein
MRMKAVDSSVLAAVGHDRATNVLQVRFRTGRVYLYLGVPRSRYNALLAADSAGHYFNEKIRTKFRAVRVPR